MNRDRLLALRRVHRLEYPLWIHYVCYAAWGACYAAAGDLDRLTGPPVVLVLLANLLHPVSMNVLNVAVDVATDARNPNKRDLALAAGMLTTRRLRALAFTEMATCLLLSVVAAVWSGRWLLPVVMGSILLAHLAYNLEPVHLKRRGLVNPVTLGVAFGFLPCVLSHLAVRPDIAAPVWIVYAGLGASVTARALWWMAPDSAADAAAGTSTWAARRGARRATVTSGGIALAAVCLLGWGLFRLYGPVWAVLGMAVGAGYVAGQLASAGRARVDYATLRRRYMTPMMIANIVFVAVPLLA